MNIKSVNICMYELKLSPPLKWLPVWMCVVFHCVLLWRFAPRGKNIDQTQPPHRYLERSTTVYSSIFFHFTMTIRRHLLDKLDDKPADETKRALMKNKLTCRPKKRSADKFDSSDPSYCQFLIKL